jgi:hypothetical protein
MQRTNRTIAAVITALALAGITAGTAGAAPTRAKDTTLSLVAYSTPKIPMGQLI